MLLGIQRPVGLLERLQARARAGAADDPEVAVNRAGSRELLHERRVVRRAERREHPLRDLTADRAEVGDDARARRPAEAVVVHHDRGLAPAELLVGDLADARVPLGTIAVVAELVRRRELQRRILGPGGADHDRLLRIRLRVRSDRDGLVTGERTDHHIGLELLHQTLGLLHRPSGGVITAAVADDLDRRAADRNPRHPGGRLLRILDLPAAVLGESGLCAANVKFPPEPEGPLAIGHDRDAYLARLRRRSGRRDDCGGREREHAKRKHELPATCETTHSYPPSLCCMTTYWCNVARRARSHSCFLMDPSLSWPRPPLQHRGIP